MERNNNLPVEAGPARHIQLLHEFMLMPAFLDEEMGAVAFRQGLPSLTVRVSLGIGGIDDQKKSRRRMGTSRTSFGLC